MMATRTKSTLKELPVPGFYNGFFTSAERTDLAKTRPDLLDEISLLRVYIRRLSSALEDTETYVDDDLKMLNCMAMVTRAVGSLMRVQSVTGGGSGTHVDKALEKAMLAQRNQWIMA